MQGVQVTPGIGSQEPMVQETPKPTPPPPQSEAPPPSSAPDPVQGEPATNTSAKDITTQFVSNTNAVVVPVTVKDSKGNFVGGLTARDFRIFENNKQQRIAFFTVDPFPLSIAFVIDQSLTQDTMTQVNNSLGALQGALAPYDEVNVIAYSNGPKELSGGWTGAQSHRLEAVLGFNKATGRDELVPVTGGALAGCSITANGNCVDPNLQVGHSAGSMEMNPTKEIHTLNDAILLAAKDLSKRPPEFRRMIYVVSDGKEYGSKASTKEVIKYLEQNKIAVYATLVGDSARWGEGYLSRFHLPLQMNDDVLPKYTSATGGDLYAERNTNGIEKSYQKVAEEAHAQYTILYYSHESNLDSKFRSVEVRVDRPEKEVEVTAKNGYYPTAENLH
jgi:VWFA-related protein